MNKTTGQQLLDSLDLLVSGIQISILRQEPVDWKAALETRIAIRDTIIRRNRPEELAELQKQETRLAITLGCLV